MRSDVYPYINPHVQCTSTHMCTLLKELTGRAIADDESDQSIMTRSALDIMKIMWKELYEVEMKKENLQRQLAALMADDPGVLGISYDDIDMDDAAKQVWNRISEEPTEYEKDSLKNRLQKVFGRANSDDLTELFDYDVIYD